MKRRKEGKVAEKGMHVWWTYVTKTNSFVVDS